MESDSDDELDMLESIDFTFPIFKKLFERKDPFNEFDDDEFKTRFRISKSTCVRVLEEIDTELEYQSDKNRSVSPLNQLLVTLKFLATGTFQNLIGDAFGVERTTVSKIIHRVLPLLAKLSGKYVKFPESDQEKNDVMKLFYQTTGFPGIIGAVDGTHIPISSPGGEKAEIFRNRKGYFSLNVQLICDPTLYISNVVSRWPGSVHDSTIFDFSHIRAQFENGELKDCSLIGDSGYPCRKYLLTPVLEPITDAEKKYNNCQVQSRNCIERTNGVLKRRFPALQYGLRIKTEKIPITIVAAVVLHNIAMQLGDDEPKEDVELIKFLNSQRQKGIQVDFSQPDIFLPVTSTSNANSAVRNALIQQYFN